MIAIVEYIHITEKIGNVYLIKRVHNMNEIVKNWLTELYEREIEEIKGTISNNHLCILGAADKEEERMFIQNDMDMREYLEVLEELKKKVKEK